MGEIHKVQQYPASQAAKRPLYKSPMPVPLNTCRVDPTYRRRKALGHTIPSMLSVGLVRSCQLGLDANDVVVGFHLDHPVDLCAGAHQLHCVGI